MPLRTRTRQTVVPQNNDDNVDAILWREDGEIFVQWTLVRADGTRVTIREQATSALAQQITGRAGVQTVFDQLADDTYPRALKRAGF